MSFVVRVIGIIGLLLGVFNRSLAAAEYPEKNSEVFIQFPYLEKIFQQIPQFQGDLSVYFLDIGVGNYVFQITNSANGKSFALKVFGWNNLKRMTRIYRMLEEVSPSLKLNGVKIPSVELFPCILEDKLVMATEFLKGRHIIDEELPQVGELMARLHLTHLAPLPFEPGIDVKLLLSECPNWEHSKALEKIWESLDLSYMKLLPKGLIHGDFSYSNVLIDQKGDFSLIDCDKMRFGYFLDDIGLSQIYFGFDENGVFKKELFKQFIAEYQKIRPLTPIERENLFTHIRKVLIEIALGMFVFLHEDGPLEDNFFYRRMREQNNYFIDPNFMAKAIESLDFSDDLLP